MLGGRPDPAAHPALEEEGTHFVYAAWPTLIFRDTQRLHREAPLLRTPFISLRPSLLTYGATATMSQRLQGTVV